MSVIRAGDYYHPEDKKALEGLKQIPGFTTVLKAFMKMFNENMIHGMNLSNKVLITERQLPELYRLLPPICETLGIQIPEFYLEMNPMPNAYTMGDSIISVTVTSGLVDLMNSREIATVLAHECGHIACHHVLYHTMATMLLQAGTDILGLGMVFTMPLQLALFHWQRCSELSCDRAAAICMESAMPVERVMAMLASGSSSISGKIDMNLYMEQAREYRSMLDENEWNKLLQSLALMQQSHPFLSVRAAEIHDWCSTPQFQKILAFKNGQEGSGDSGCPACGAGVDQEWAFCKHCGHKLK